MADFWRSAGWRLVEPADGGRIRITDDWLRAYLFRPELAPIDESCPAERALHERLAADPRALIDDAALDQLADADVGTNYRVYRTYRDRLLARPSIEAAYLDMIENGIEGIPPLFLDQLVHVQLRHLLRNCVDPIRLRAAEPFFRTQNVSIQDGRVMLADEETVDMHASGQGFGSLGKLLVQIETKLASVELDVLDEANAEIYWQRSDRFDTVFDLGFTRPGLDGFCRVLEAWVSHLRGVDVSIQPVQEISDQHWSWHVGLDAEANAFLNDLYQGDEIDEARRARLLSLFRLEFADPADMLERVRGRPVYLGLMMAENERLTMKPQNILANLPLAVRS
ncbi:MAG: DUF6352 family protein [Alphaproteobacteria bacterium]|nr:DUF6352 family protein [Alphaproteobacteria bacterium]